MRLAWPIALAALLAVPAAEACSLAYRPFDQPQWPGDLHFVDGEDLQRVDGAFEATVATAFFLSYAPVPGGLLVAGQDGLGAGCEGDDWLRLVHDGDGAVAWQRDGEARVFAHADGPVVVMAPRVYRFTDGELLDTGRRVPDDVYVEGVTAAGLPVYRAGSDVIVGDVTLTGPLNGGMAIAHNATHTALARANDAGVSLTVLDAHGSATETAWSASWQELDVAWADAWVVVAGGRAVQVDGGTVTDLGVADAVAVGADGPRALVFHASGQDAGYVAFRDGHATEAWQRSTRSGGGQAVWTPATVQSTPGPVPATTTSPTVSPGPGPGTPADDDGGPGIPALPAGGLLAALALAAGLRRRP